MVTIHRFDVFLISLDPPMSAEIVLDQIRTIDKTRLIKKLGTISSLEARSVLDVLQKLFAD